MCDNLPAAFKEERRVARKPHRCCECSSIIRKGESYIYSSGIWDGRPDQFKTCETCDHIRDVYQREIGESVAFGELIWGNIREHAFDGFTERDFMLSIGLTEDDCQHVMDSINRDEDGFE